MKTHPAAGYSLIIHSARCNKRNADRLGEELGKARQKRAEAWDAFFASLDGPVLQCRMLLATWERWDDVVRQLEGKRAKLDDNAKWVRTYDELKALLEDK